MLRKDAEHEIIREWMNLPETERQSEHQAAQFALKMKRKYPFDYAGGDRYQEIRRNDAAALQAACRRVKMTMG